jgi:hypothetical protein
MPLAVDVVATTGPPVVVGEPPVVDVDVEASASVQISWTIFWTSAFC